MAFTNHSGLDTLPSTFKFEKAENPMKGIAVSVVVLSATKFLLCKLFSFSGELFVSQSEHDE